MASRNAFLVDWVKGAYGLELGLVPVLEQQTAQLKDDPELRKDLDLHLKQTRQHVELLRDYLNRKGENTSSIRPIDPIMRSYIRPNGGEPDIARQTELVDYVTEVVEVASYRALNSLASMVGDQEASKVFEQILGDEIAIADLLDKRLPGHNGHMVAERDNIAIARDVLAALNAHDLVRFEKFLAPDYRCEMPGVTGSVSREQTLAMMKTGRTAFPDDHFDIQRIFAAGDDVIVEWIWTGTHLGALANPNGPEIAATGKKLCMRGSTALTFRDGKVIEERDYFDPAEIVQQLGVTPVAGQVSPGAVPKTGREVVHLEIPAKDRKSAARFYKEIFGWEYQEAAEEMNYTTFSTGTVPGGFPELAMGYKPGDVTFYVDSKNIDDDLRKAEKLGAKTIVPRTEIPGMGWFAIFTDPTGNRVGLFMVNV